MIPQKPDRFAAWHDTRPFFVIQKDPGYWDGFRLWKRAESKIGKRPLYLQFCGRVSRPHPLNTRAHHAEMESRKQDRTEQLRQEVAAKSPPPSVLQRAEQWNDWVKMKEMQQ